MKILAARPGTKQRPERVTGELARRRNDVDGIDAALAVGGHYRLDILSDHALRTVILPMTAIR
jgi:hypothetical protein